MSNEKTPGCSGYIYIYGIKTTQLYFRFHAKLGECTTATGFPAWCCFPGANVTQALRATLFWTGRWWALGVCEPGGCSFFKQTVAAINEWNPIYQNSSSDLWLEDVQKLQGFRYMVGPNFEGPKVALDKVCGPSADTLCNTCTHVPWKAKKR